jgi:hypothetical protein
MHYKAGDVVQVVTIGEVGTVILVQEDETGVFSERFLYTVQFTDGEEDYFYASNLCPVHE